MTNDDQNVIYSTLFICSLPSIPSMRAFILLDVSVSLRHASPSHFSMTSHPFPALPTDDPAYPIFSIRPAATFKFGVSIQSLFIFAQCSPTTGNLIPLSRSHSIQLQLPHIPNLQIIPSTSPSAYSQRFRHPTRITSTYPGQTTEIRQYLGKPQALRLT